jgi:hypothetical protein
MRKQSRDIYDGAFAMFCVMLLMPTVEKFYRLEKIDALDALDSIVNLAWKDLASLNFPFAAISKKDFQEKIDKLLVDTDHSSHVEAHICLDMISIFEGLFNGFNKNPVEFSLSQIESSVVQILAEKYFDQVWSGYFSLDDVYDHKIHAMIREKILNCRERLTGMGVPIFSTRYKEYTFDVIQYALSHTDPCPTGTADMRKVVKDLLENFDKK